jgi:hypothetical protein
MIREVLAPRVVVFFFVLWVLLTFVINSTIQLALRADAPPAVYGSIVALRLHWQVSAQPQSWWVC